MLTLFRSVRRRSLGGWCAEDSDKDPFLQVDLVNTTIVSAVATQGLPGNGNLALRFKLNYSCDGKVWFEYQQGQVSQTFVSHQPANICTEVIYPTRGKVFHLISKHRGVD